jgi:hypothetical protein
VARKRRRKKDAIDVINLVFSVRLSVLDLMSPVLRSITHQSGVR